MTTGRFLRTCVTWTIRPLLPCSAEGNRSSSSLPGFEGKHAAVVIGAAAVHRRGSSGRLDRAAYCVLVNFGSFAWLYSSLPDAS